MSDEKTILLIDDDHDLVRGASVRLRRAGYRTISADNGQHGLESASENHPDAILLDLRMPVMDGLTALRELRNRADTQRIPVVMLSASPKSQTDALDAGARFFLSKPYDGEALLAAVDAAVAEAKQSNEAE